VRLPLREQGRRLGSGAGARMAHAQC
jgi:hypothetical protein